MANYISKIQLSSGEYLLKDQTAWNEIGSIKQALNSVIRFKGVSTTAITNGGKEVPSGIYGASGKPALGDMVLYGKQEFVWITSTDSAGADSSHWVLLDALDAYGALASKNGVVIAANGSHSHTVPVNTYAGAATTSTGSFTPAGTVSISQTKDGTGLKPVLAVTQPTVTLSGGGAKALTSVSIPSTTTQSVTTGFTAGTLPSLTLGTAVAIPNVTSAGSAPSLEKVDVSVLTSVKSAGSAPSLKSGTTAVTSFNALSSTGTATVASVSGETLSITNGSAPTASAITFSAGSMPTFNSGTSTKISSWSAGSAATLGEAISIKPVSGWSAGTLASASSVTVLKQDGDGVVSVAAGGQTVLTALPKASASGVVVAFANGLATSFTGTAGSVSVTGTPKLTATATSATTSSNGSHSHSVSYN